MHEPEVAPQKPRCPVQADERRLNGERAAAAHGIDEVSVSVPASRKDNGGGKRLLHGRRKRDLTVPAPGKWLSRCIKVDGTLLILPVEMHYGPVPFRTRIGPSSPLLLDPVHNGILTLQACIARVFDRLVLNT